MEAPINVYPAKEQASMDNSSEQPWDGQERRKGRSTIEQGSTILSHAIQHLIADRMDGHKEHANAKLKAVGILSRLRLGIGVTERRNPDRALIERKLRSILTASIIEDKNNSERARHIP